MNIKEFLNQAMEPSGLEGLGGPYMELNEDKLARLIIEKCIELGSPEKIKEYFEY